MNGNLPYQLMADVVLSLHVALVIFIVGGLVLIIVGNLVAWRWVNILWLRVAYVCRLQV